MDIDGKLGTYSVCNVDTTPWHLPPIKPSVIRIIRDLFTSTESLPSQGFLSAPWTLDVLACICKVAVGTPKDSSGVLQPVNVCLTQVTASRVWGRVVTRQRNNLHRAG